MNRAAWSVLLPLLLACGQEDGPPRPRVLKPRRALPSKPAEPQPPPAPKAPDGPIQRITTSEIEFGPARRPDGFTVLRMTLRADNPNEVDIRIDRIRYTIHIGDRVAAQEVWHGPEVVPARGHAVLRVEYNLPGWPDLYEIMKSAELATFEGYIAVSDPLPPGVARRDDFFFQAIGLPR